MDESSTVTDNSSEAHGQEQAEAPFGIKLYVGVYALGWIGILALLLREGGDMLIYIPLTLAGLFIVYHVLKLKRWAWIVTILLHTIGILWSVVQVISGEVTTTVFGVRGILSLIILGYLYSAREYFG